MREEVVHRNASAIKGKWGRWRLDVGYTLKGTMKLVFLGHIVRLAIFLDFWIPAQNRPKSVIAGLPKWVPGFPNVVTGFPNRGSRIRYPVFQKMGNWKNESDSVPGFPKGVPCFPKDGRKDEKTGSETWWVLEYALVFIKVKQKEEKSNFQLYCPFKIRDGYFIIINFCKNIFKRHL